MNALLSETIDKIKENLYWGEEVYELFRAYYDIYILDYEKANNVSFADELNQEPMDRESGIYEAVCWIIENGYDLNYGDGFYNALMYSVSFADAPMTEFLIDHGADVNYWIGIEEALPCEQESNYYLENIDCSFMNSDKPMNPDYVHALLKTAQVLLEKGNTGSFGGFAMSADAEKREIYYFAENITLKY